MFVRRAQEQGRMKSAFVASRTGLIGEIVQEINVNLIGPSIIVVISGMIVEQLLYILKARIVQCINGSPAR